MSCRTTAAGSAFTTLARHVSGLSDVQTLSEFHLLRAEGRAGNFTDNTPWDEVLDVAARNVETTTMTEARRASLLRRIAAARTENPDHATRYAVRQIGRRAQTRARMVAWHLRAVARDTDESVTAVQARYNELCVSTTRTRSTPEGYDSDAVRAARAENLPGDRGSVHAMSVLRAEALTARVARVRNGPQRVTHQALPASLRAGSGGYDPDGGRLEIRGVSGTLHAYRNVDPQVWTDLQAGHSASFGAIRQDPEHLYPTQADADLDSAARQCADCGQFAASSHACPVRLAREAAANPPVVADQAMPAARPGPTAIRSWRTRYQSISTPDDASMRADANFLRPANLTEMRAQAANGPVQFAMESRISVRDAETGRYGRVLGDVTYDRPARGQHTAAYSNVRCICQQYQEYGHCPHVDIYTTLGNQVLLPQSRAAGSAGAAAFDPAQAQGRAEAALLQDWTRDEEQRQEAAASWADSAPEDNYSNNPDKFDADVDAALTAKRESRSPIEYLTENATAGLCTPDTQRSFGVELEFDLPAAGRYEALRKIGEDLHAAGLTRVAYQEGYGAAKRRGYTTEHEGGWSFEHDMTVSGEVVSPVMQDTPETWEKLATVCEIVKRHGGKATARTGSHVHVSTPSASLGTATSLARMVNQNEDVLYRISQNPGAAKHRPLNWCGPNTEVSPAGYTEMREVRSGRVSHRVSLNLASVSGDSSDHAELRHWDASLDPATIQMQITVSAAIIAASEREGAKPNAEMSVRGREKLGSHVVRNQFTTGGTRRRLTKAERAEDTATARSFADTLFHDSRSKARFAALFAVTKWQKLGR